MRKRPQTAVSRPGTWEIQRTITLYSWVWQGQGGGVGCPERDSFARSYALDEDFIAPNWD